jgi:aspartyl-tRNA(Asn)/glutamyl-tRNA(Gln) amidotransferase subunit B
MFDEAKGITIKMRSKEHAQDYRFISEPDLPVLNISKLKIEKIKKELPETPQEKLKKLIKKYNIEKKYAEVLIKKIDIADFFEKILGKVDTNLACSWTVVELQRTLNYNKKEIDEVEINPEHFIELIKLIENKKITELKGKEILNKFIPKSFSPAKEAESNSKISSQNELTSACKEIIKENPVPVKDYHSGKQEALNFLIGKVMQKTNKRADFKTTREILEVLLK